MIEEDVYKPSRISKKKTQERDKLYIRLNLHNESNASKMSVSMEAKKGNPYAWQVKIPNKMKF